MSNRAVRTSSRALTCCRCTAPISPGDPHVLDHARPAHQDCIALLVRPTVRGRTGAEPPRYLQDSHAGRPCEGCGVELVRDDVVVHVRTRPWHASCRRWSITA